MQRLELPKIGFIINNKCNLQCYGCNHFSNYGIKDDDYTYENLHTFFDYFSKLPKHLILQKFVLLGGEPFLNKDFDRYIELCSNYHNTVFKLLEINTNGTILNKKVINTLSKYKKFIHIVVAFHDNRLSEKVNRFILELKKANLSYTFLDTTKDWRIFLDFRKNKIYPANEKDYKASWLNCHFNKCKILKDDKIYYCNPIATVKEALKTTKQLEDAVWKPYLDVGYFKYTKLDPVTFVEKLCKFKASPYCSMCFKERTYINNHPIFKKDYLNE